MRWDDLRRPAFIRDLLLEIFSPDPVPSFEYGSIDRCQAEGAVLAWCVEHAYACRYRAQRDAYYCSMPIGSAPPTVQALIVPGPEGRPTRLCPHRSEGWKPGPATKRTQRGLALYKTRAVRMWVRDTIKDIARAEDPLGAAARGCVHDDWSGVDALLGEKAVWILDENDRRRRTSNPVLSREEWVNAWRSEAQWRLCQHISRRAAREQPWKKMRRH